VLKIGLDQLSSDILGDFHRFGGRSPLRHQARQVLAGRQVPALRQGFDVNGEKYLFHEVYLRAL
jgi:hypothetical protein